MGTLRVISGKAKGARLRTVPGDTTRPITDQVKEALFNIIGQGIVGTMMLDLFGGTGAVGIEALSRGAMFATFLDTSHRAVSVIKENLQTTRLNEFAEVIKRDAFDFLQSVPTRQYDYVYIAPPQYKNMWLKTMRLIDTNPGWLVENGELIVQINPIEWQAIEFTHFKPIDQRRYGDTMLIFFESVHSKDITN